MECQGWNVGDEMLEWNGLCHLSQAVHYKTLPYTSIHFKIFQNTSKLI